MGRGWGGRGGRGWGAIFHEKEGAKKEREGKMEETCRIWRFAGTEKFFIKTSSEYCMSD